MIDYDNKSIAYIFLLKNYLSVARKKHRRVSWPTFMQIKQQQHCATDANRLLPTFLAFAALLYCALLCSALLCCALLVSALLCCDLLYSAGDDFFRFTATNLCLRPYILINPQLFATDTSQSQQHFKQYLISWKQARKAWRCDKYLQIWHYHSLTDSLNSARRCYCIFPINKSGGIEVGPLVPQNRRVGPQFMKNVFLTRQPL